MSGTIAWRALLASGAWRGNAAPPGHELLADGYAIILRRETALAALDAAECGNFKARPPGASKLESLWSKIVAAATKPAQLSVVEGEFGEAAATVIAGGATMNALRVSFLLLATGATEVRVDPTGRESAAVFLKDGEAVACLMPMKKEAP